MADVRLENTDVERDIFPTFDVNWQDRTQHIFLTYPCHVHTRLSENDNVDQAIQCHHADTSWSYFSLFL